jgi:hypothetical protein
MMGDISRYISALTLGAATAVLIAAAPAASAAPLQPCTASGGATVCQTPGNAQITTGPTDSVSRGSFFYGPFFAYDRPPVRR